MHYEHRFPSVLSYLKHTALGLHLGLSDSINEEKGTPRHLMSFFHSKIIYLPDFSFLYLANVAFKCLKSVKKNLKILFVHIWYCWNTAIKNVLTDTVSSMIHSSSKYSCSIKE